MIYLLYFQEGFIKKFPLEKPVITIGRSNENDLMINDEFLSRKHLQVEIRDNSIYIRDRDSLNGTFINNNRIKDGIIRISESFVIGGTEFFLKEGMLDEFKPADELIPLFDNISLDNKKIFKNIETRYIKDIYNETLKHILKTGLSKSSFSDFLLDLSNCIANLSGFGSLFIVQQNENKEDYNILLAVKQDKEVLQILRDLLKDNPRVFLDEISYKALGNNRDYYYSFPFKIEQYSATMIYISHHGLDHEDPKVERFLHFLAKEIVLFSQFFGKGKQIEETKEDDLGTADDFIVSSKAMKEIIKQTKKIGKTDMFILIQGESGTGKELLAQFIHQHSQRNKKKLIGINCAAIPETLLESELFGYEKGAFTGAYGQKKGKLELASGSTLILDEIGDMPLNLQSKLLRALQENEFYRLGGSTPVKVDLRIISTTNKNVKQLIKEDKFREDLYYRLVHRTISIPPLRERREDISILINYFTQVFCHLTKKVISGYSVKALETLQNYGWPGNVRQLKNEINSIINLTDNGEMVSFDILSDEIRLNEESFDLPNISTEVQMVLSEKEKILRILHKHEWNKSKAAREMNMTYQGLHKKMKRLGITKSETSG